MAEDNFVAEINKITVDLEEWGLLNALKTAVGESINFSDKECPLCDEEKLYEECICRAMFEEIKVIQENIFTIYNAINMWEKKNSE